MKNICDCMSRMNLEEAVRIANGLKVKIELRWVRSTRRTKLYEIMYI